MISDVRTTFAAAVASGNGTAQLGDVIDLMATGVDGNVDDNVGGQPNIGNGQPVFVTLQVNESYTGTNLTDDVTFLVVTSDNANLTSYVTLITSANYVYGGGTDLVAGQTVITQALPITTYKRYLGIIEVVSGVTTTGKIDAFLHLDPNKWSAYAQFKPGL